MWIFALIVLILALFFLFCLKGRTGHSGMAELRKWSYAHRGLHDKEKPENSLAAFWAAKAAGYGSELDLHLMKDGNLAVVHDSWLTRMTGREVQIEDLTVADLKNYPLGGTEETIPLFSQVLQMYDGAAPLIVELKTERGNHEALCIAACKMLDTYKGAYCIESFDPRCIMWLRKHRPDIIRGQLSCNWFKGKSNLPWIVKFLMAFHLSNLLTRPDFIAYNFPDRKAFGTAICRKLWGVQGVAWTLRTKQDYNTAVKEDWLPIFENLRP